MKRLQIRNNRITKGLRLKLGLDILLALTDPDTRKLEKRWGKKATWHHILMSDQ